MTRGTGIISVDLMFDFCPLDGHTPGVTRPVVSCQPSAPALPSLESVFLANNQEFIRSQERKRKNASAPGSATGAHKKLKSTDPVKITQFFDKK